MHKFKTLTNSVLVHVDYQLSKESPEEHVNKVKEVIDDLPFVKLPFVINVSEVPALIDTLNERNLPYVLHQSPVNVMVLSDE